MIFRGLFILCTTSTLCCKQSPKIKDNLKGFDPKNIVEQGIDKAKNLVNDKAGKDVVNDEHTSKAEEVVNENVQKITDKFGK